MAELYSKGAAMMYSCRAALIALALASATSAVAAPDPYKDSAPCVTKAECDYRQDQIDTANRRAEWDRNEKAQQDATVARQQMRAQAQSASEAGKMSRIQEVMQRRREAAAAAAAAGK
jgi:hypothetical protein